jgi:hypothetical protein
LVFIQQSTTPKSYNALVLPAFINPFSLAVSGVCFADIWNALYLNAPPEIRFRTCLSNGGAIVALVAVGVKTFGLVPFGTSGRSEISVLLRNSVNMLGKVSLSSGCAWSQDGAERSL